MRLFKPNLLALSSLFTWAHADDSCSGADRTFITSLRTGRYVSSIGSECACSILNELFSAKLLFPGSPGFTAQATRYYDRREALTPRCIFLPSTANDVAKGIVVFEACHSEFAIRGGGHMPVAGAANTPTGVLLALNSLTQLQLSDEDATLSVGPGLTWYDVYSFLQPHGLIAIGGRLKTIGVPGLTLGGGISYFTSKYGFAMDNVVAYDVAIASGEVITASTTSHSELFWALKGGGSNFGVVTGFTLKTYEVPLISTTIQTFAEERIPEFISAIAELAKFQDSVDTGAGGIFTIDSTPSTAAMVANFLGVQAGSILKPAVFDNFTNIPSQFEVYNVTTLAEWCETMETPFQQFRNVYGMHAVVADEGVMQSMYETFKAAVPAMANINGLDTNLVFQPIPKSATAVAKSNDIGNTWDLDDGKAYIFWLISTQWLNASDDKTVMAWSANLVENLHAANLKAGVGIDFMYVNDCADGQSPYEGLPRRSLEKLREVRGMYDPGLVFKRLDRGGFKF